MKGAFVHGGCVCDLEGTAAAVSAVAVNVVVVGGGTELVVDVGGDSKVKITGVGGEGLC